MKTAGRYGGRAAGGLVALMVCAAFPSVMTAQAQVLDDFEALPGWISAPSDGVALDIRSDSGHTGKAMRLDFDFQGHGGYA